MWIFRMRKPKALPLTYGDNEARAEMIPSVTEKALLVALVLGLAAVAWATGQVAVIGLAPIAVIAFYVTSEYLSPNSRRDG
jgi:hypothetical protein